MLAAGLGVAHRVHFLGSESGADISRFYRAIDVFLMPSKFEGFGRTLVEAMSQGTLTVAHDLDVLREVAGTAASLLPLHKALWAEEISALQALSSDALATRRRKLRERASTFSLPKMVDGYL
ncbi:glycosyltransferase, partial [Mesorhizobium japonicum]|uniref:glycosyltransferase n=1 Tax=Mesorhizobium japonicum TaxID=2066070 RepID=UPI003B5BAA3E